jgi:hypothetical protein
VFQTVRVQSNKQEIAESSFKPRAVVKIAKLSSLNLDPAQQLHAIETARLLPLVLGVLAMLVVVMGSKSNRELSQ